MIIIPELQFGTSGEIEAFHDLFSFIPLSILEHRYKVNLRHFETSLPANATLADVTDLTNTWVKAISPFVPQFMGMVAG